MKKLSVLLIAMIMGSYSVAYAVKTVAITPKVQSGIAKYRTGNYLGAMQDLQSAVAQNPKDDMANYYLGNVLVKIGKKEEAKKSYEAVKSNNANKALVDYSNFAIGCIDSQGSGGGSPVQPQPGQPTPLNPCDTAALDLSGDIGVFIKSGQFMHQDAKTKIQETQLKNVQDSINGGAKSIEFSNYRYLNDASDAMPSDKEIADAVKTLAKIGFNPFNNASMSPQYSFANQTNNNNQDPMLSLMMAQGQGGKINPQMIQSMMMNQMMPSYDFAENNHNRGY